MIQETERVINHLNDLVRSEGSQTALAGRLGVSLSYLSKVLAGKQEPGEKILEGIGWVRVVQYYPKGTMEQPWAKSVAEYAGRLPVPGGAE